VKVWANGKGLEVYSKTLHGDNTRAVALFNRTDLDENITVRWSDLGLPAGQASVRDLWKHTGLGTFTDRFTGFVPPHEVVLLKVVSVKPKRAPL
jgi:hypothetical protein